MTGHSHPHPVQVRLKGQAAIAICIPRCGMIVLVLCVRCPEVRRPRIVTTTAFMGT